MVWDHGWMLSIQADKAGYQCSPKKRLETLEEYDTVEVKIDGPHGMVVDPHTMEFPIEVAAKFPHLETGGGPSIGGNLTWTDVEAVIDAIRKASFRPNAGVPRGIVGWAGRTVYHGTSMEDGEAIMANGIDVRHGDGYFGRAFYVAEERELAASNYAEFSGDEDGGAILEVMIEEGARILDLRNEEDSTTWINSGLVELLGTPDFDQKARRKGIDGIYDRSVGGLAIYNASVVSEPHMASARERIVAAPLTPKK